MSLAAAVVSLYDHSGVVKSTIYALACMGLVRDSHLYALIIIRKVFGLAYVRVTYVGGNCMTCRLRTNVTDGAAKTV